MNVTITPHTLSGAITPPPSKSQAHRAVIAAALSRGVSHIDNLVLSQDVSATLRCMRALGAEVSDDGRVIDGAGGLTYACAPCCSSPLLDCGESGSTLRFLLPVALALRAGGLFRGRGRLMERPLTPYFDLFEQKGVFYKYGDGILSVAGRLPAGDYALRGDVSSQFVSGLLFALPLLAGDSRILLTTPLESRGYVDLTLDALARFGVEARFDGERTFFVPGGQTYTPCDCAVEADYSQAAVFFALRDMGCEIAVQGLDARSRQGDRVAVDYFARMNAPGEVTLDVSQCPDLVPALAARAAVRAGEHTRIANAARLRIKESDRLACVTAQLNRLGAQVTEGADFLDITGVSRLTGGTADACGDHRIAMMLAAAAVRADGPVTVLGAQCVDKSYPGFWEDYEALGGVLARSGKEGETA